MTTSSDRPSSRERLLDATVQLLRIKGPTASGTKEMLDTAGAPRGSFYFHFPDGKDQLVAEALHRAAATTGEAIQAALEDASVELPERVERFVLTIADELVLEDYQLGCAVGATALETAATTPALRQVTETAFASWSTTLVAHFVHEGITPDQAVTLADSVIAGMEGATMLARARHDTAPLRHVAATLRTAVAAALPRPSTARQKQKQ
jgi:TetR/AcrR family transcriptional repressor of lmrAB and yxaGH operons